MKMYRIGLTVAVILAAVAGKAQEKTAAEKKPAACRTCIIPQPQQLVEGNGNFLLNKYTQVQVSSPQLNDVASFLGFELLKFRRLPLTKGTGSPAKPAIQLVVDKSGFNDEAYELNITAESIVVRSSTAAGVFNGAVSLLQLIVNAEQSNGNLLIPAVTIKDQPQYKWRGLMLDASRYFISKEKLKSIVDWMAFYKLNRLHWHLTDVSGWRMEIKQYPKLALVGGIGDHNDPNKPAQYYTQQEIAEVIAYAAKRNIQVIPEIDMPGHATAANNAYPAYSGGGSGRHPNFTFDPGNESVYGYLTNILREVNAIFGSGMIHIGGDEVSYGSDQWKTNKGIQELMAQNSLKDINEVEQYFVKRIADSVFQLNAKILAWDEQVGAGLPKDKTILFWWRDDQPKLFNTILSKGYQTVVCPRIPYYLDYVQYGPHLSGRQLKGKVNDLEAIYRFSAVDLMDNKNDQDKVLGVQGNLWTEMITNDNRLDYMLFPRIAAVAESAWTTDRSDYPGFLNRLSPHIKQYRLQNIYYFNPINPAESPEPVYRVAR
jgi:hexosaminidase